MTKAALVLAMLTTVSLTGCPGEEYASCSGPVVSPPNGKCSARYYQTDYHSGGQVTQALVSCEALPAKLGGNVVAIHSIAHGIGLRWLDPSTLEVSVPAGVPLQNQRSGDAYGGYALRYVYRDLTEGDPAFLGCGLGDSGGT